MQTSLALPADAAVAPPDALAVAGFWRDAGPAGWFRKDPAFDATFRTRFLALHEAAAAGALNGWGATATGALALVVLLDQFPRNAFRGTPRMYATDVVARAAADRAIRRGHDRAVDPELALMFVLPFAHSERLEDQERSVALAAALGEAHHERARHHRDIVRRFGRFPHRNAILGRAATAAEDAYLEAGGYAG